MALLHRFTQLNDRYNTSIFTFIITKSVIRDPHRDATTKDFIYGYHRWAITFTRSNEKALGVYLILRNPCAHSKCYADYSFTLLNKEHYSKNETISEKQVCFTIERPAQGLSKWILLNDISVRKFSDETGEILLELSLSNILTTFELDLNVISVQNIQRNFKLETSYIQYGGFDWNLTIKPHETDINNDEFVELKDQTTVNVFLNRLSGFDRLVRVKYRLNLVNGKHKDSEILDQISDGEGRIVGTQINLFNLIEIAKANKNIVKFHFEMYCANLISEAKVPIVRETQPVTNCYDRNKQGWCIEADLEEEHLKLKLFFMDLHSVPRNHLRFISWNSYVVTKNSRNDTRESLSVLNSPHSNYYITDGMDVGVTMCTNIESRAILKVSPKNYLETDGHLTVHIEWIDSILLFNNTYHKYDDLARIHCFQMRREIAALCAEIYSMERQICSYQKSIYGVNSRGTSHLNIATNTSHNSNHNASSSNLIANTPQHRVSDPYILDNLFAPLNSLLKTGNNLQNVQNTHLSPSHFSKSNHQNLQAHNLQNQNMQSQTLQSQNLQPQNLQTQNLQLQNVQSQNLQAQNFQQKNLKTQNLPQNRNNSMHQNLQQQQLSPNYQQIQPNIPKNPTTKSHLHSNQQITTLNNSMSNLNLQNNFSNVPTNTTMPNMLLQYQTSQINTNLPVNWQQNALNSNLNQPHVVNANRSTGHLPTIGINSSNNVNNNINLVNYTNLNSSLPINTSSNSSMSGINITNDVLTRNNTQQLITTPSLSRHLSNSSCNLNSAINYANTNNPTNLNNLNISSSNFINNMNKTMSTSNQNINNPNLSNLTQSHNISNQVHYTANLNQNLQAHVQHSNQSINQQQNSLTSQQNKHFTMHQPTSTSQQLHQLPIRPQIQHSVQPMNKTISNQTNMYRNVYDNEQRIYSIQNTNENIHQS